MLYCYLSDSALTPLINNIIFNGNDIFGSYVNRSGNTVRSGVGQVNERVLSIFNSDDTASAGELPAKYHNLVKDPRSEEERLRGLFTGDTSYVTDTTNERAVGNMFLHFDKYWADADNLPENNIAALNTDTYIPQFKKLFNVMELVVLSHVFDNATRMWIYKTAGELDTILRGNASLYGTGSMDSLDTTPGYVAGSLSVSDMSISDDKQATVRNTNSTGTVKTEIGTNVISKNAGIIFANVIQFQFRFSAFSAPTWFKIYLNPDTLVKEYAKCRITNIVFAASPSDLVNLDYNDVLTALSSASQYVANTLTHEVTKTTTDPLLTTNHTGAVDFPVRYMSDKTLHFTCIYKGRVPSDSEMRSAIKDILESARGGASVEDIFPELYIKTNFIIVPLYDTRVTADTNLNIKYCKNIISLDDLFKNYNGKNTAASLADVPTDVINTASVLNVAGYFMHALVYSLSYTDVHYKLTTDTVFMPNKTYYTRTGSSFNYVYTVAAVVTGDDIPSNTYYEYTSTSETIPIKLSSVDEMSSYQPIGTTDVYWYTLSDEAAKLNTSLSELIGSQLNGLPVPADVEYHEETKTVFDGQGPKNYLTFAAGGYSFSMMTKDSYYR